MEFLVSERAALVAPAVTNNSRSKFVVVWGVQNGARLVGALFDLGGHPLGAEFGVSAATDAVCSFPVAAHMAGAVPGFAVAWIEASPPRVMVRRFGPEGTPIDPPLRVSEGLPLAGFGPALARAPDASSIACWAAEDNTIRAAVFDRMGKPRGGEFVVSLGGFHTGPVRVVGLENNSFAVCWFGGEGPGAGNVVLQVLATTGEKVGGSRVLDLSRLGGNFVLAPIVNLSPVNEPGHFALIHVTSELPQGASSDSGGGQRLVIGTIFGPSGDRVQPGSFNITQRERNTIASNLAITPLPARRFLVAWSERSIPDLDEDATGEDIKALLCEEDHAALPGSELGGLIAAIDVNAFREGDQVLPSAAFAIDGETGASAMVIAWLDGNTGSADSAVRAVKARVFARTDLPA